MEAAKRQKLSTGLPSVFDENIVTNKNVIKARPIINPKRSVLGDIANQKVQALKQTEMGKIQKNPKPKVIKTSSVLPKLQRPKTAEKDDAELDSPNNMDDLDAFIDADDYMMDIQDNQILQQQELLQEKSHPLDQVQQNALEDEHFKNELARLGIANIDLEDANDPLAVTEYVVPIFKYLLEMEVKHQPNPTYMEGQSDLTWKMRSTLANWLVEVHWKYKLYPETLFLTVNIMDRFLAIKAISRDKLQLVGVTSMLIASKFEEIYSPSVEDFLYVCNDSYTNDELLRMERLILCTLGFQLGSPCALTFLRRISKAEQYDIPSRTVAKYLIEITVLDEKFLNYHPSLIAAASTWLARKMLKKGDWDKTLEFYSGYNERAIEPCVNEMLAFLQSNTKFKSIYKKYSSSKFLRASLFAEQKIAAWMRGEEGPSPPSADD